MSFLARLFRREVQLDPGATQRLSDWQARAPLDLTGPLRETRCVVLDVESTGLDLRRDRLIAIGACAVRDGRIDLADSLEIVLRQEQVSGKDNILIHGIGGEAQREGLEPAEALLRFLDYLGRSPLVAFHVAFDKTMIERAIKQYLGFTFKHDWLDLAYVMPGLLPKYARRFRALDHWTQHFEISNYARHSALADALASAQLMLAATPLAEARDLLSYDQWRELEKAQRWLAGTH